VTLSCLVPVDIEKIIVDERLKGVVVPVAGVVLPLVTPEAGLEVRVAPVHSEAAEAKQVPVRGQADV